MAGYCTLVLYFHEPQASENTAAHSCNIQPYCLLTHQIIYIDCSLVPRPSPAPVFDRLQYTKTEGEGLVNLTT